MLYLQCVISIVCEHDEEFQSFIFVVLEIISLLIHLTSILPPYTNQSIDMDHKSIGWFLFEGMC